MTKTIALVMAITALGAGSPLAAMAQEPELVDAEDLAAQLTGLIEDEVGDFPSGTERQFIGEQVEQIWCRTTQEHLEGSPYSIFGRVCD